MLTFIITLLMALVFSVGGINIPSSSSGNLNTTDATLFRRSDEFLPCSPDTGAFEKCWCFSFESDTVDVPRTPMIDGILEACDKFTGGIGEPAQNYGLGEGLPSRATAYHYYEPTRENEEGMIALSIQVRDDPSCAGPTTVSWEYCWDLFHFALDSCDTGWENRKNGGFVYNGCIWFILDPNSSVNWPYTFLD